MVHLVRQLPQVQVCPVMEVTFCFADTSIVGHSSFRSPSLFRFSLVYLPNLNIFTFDIFQSSRLDFLVTVFCEILQHNVGLCCLVCLEHC